MLKIRVELRKLFHNNLYQKKALFSAFLINLYDLYIV